jgi:hypothetical protein
MLLHFEEDFEIPGQDEVFYGSQFLHHGVFHFGFVRIFLMLFRVFKGLCYSEIVKSLLQF